MTPEEQAAWAAHFERLKSLIAQGVIVLAGPTLGRTNTGIAVFQVPDEDAARRQTRHAGSGRRNRRTPAGAPVARPGRSAAACPARPTSLLVVPPLRVGATVPRNPAALLPRAGLVRLTVLARLNPQFGADRDDAFCDLLRIGGLIH